MNKWLTYVLVGLAFGLPVLGILNYGDRGLQALLWNAEEVFAAPISRIKHASINYGVYDPVFDAGAGRAFKDAKGVAIEHIFVSWIDPDGSSIAEMQRYSRERNRWLMVTLEPFSDGRTVTSGGFLNQVIAGAYDGNIDAVCRSLGNTNSPVLIRWGHEMETRAERYPWSGQPPEDYIAAYRHFVRSCRKWIREGYYMWSPRGDVGLAEYYPGKRYVDYVGLSIYGLPVRDIQIAGRPRSFLEEFAPRYERVIAFNLPVMIAELGVAGDPAYQELWMRGLFRNAGKFPLLKTAVYFNAKDSPGAWPEEYGVPDWRISAEIFECSLPCS